MNFIKRAFTSIKRNLGKTCLLFLIVLILCSVISGTISANQAAENTERNLMNNMLTITQLEFDWDKLMEAEGVDPNDWEWRPDPDLVTRLTPEMIREVAALPYVETYDFFVQTGGLRTLDIEMFEPPIPDGGGGMWVDESELGVAFVIRGVQNPNIFDIQQGLIELVHGRVFTEYETENPSNVILVSEEFAAYNGLTVGSTITFRNIVFTPQLDMMWDPNHFTEENIFAEETYVLEVVGLFRPANIPDMGDPWNNWHFAWELGNRIYAPNSFAISANLFRTEAELESLPVEDREWRFGIEEGDEVNPEDLIWIDHFFSLYNPNDFPAFREAVAESLPYFRVVDAGGGMRDVSAALETMRSLTQTILFLAIGASLLILTLLITLFLRDRKREVGIYLALGEKKRKLVSQFVLEIMIIAFISIVVALFAGNILSANLSENMLINDLAADENGGRDQWWAMGEDNPFMWQGYVNEVDTDEVIASYDVSLTPMIILLFFAIGLGTTLIATVIPMIYVVRLNPKKIMM